MTPETYVQHVLRSAAPHHLEPNDKTILLGLRGETGEVADVVKKAIGHRQGWAPFTSKGKLVDPRANMIKELGDCSWYGAAHLHRLESTNVMNVTTIEFTEGLEDLADMLCDAGARLGHSTFTWEAADAGLEFFALIRNIGQRMSPPVSIAEIWEANVAKLQVRYPEGFTTEASMAKVDESVKADSISHNSIPAALEFEVDNHATAGNGYPSKPVGTFEEARSFDSCGYPSKR